MIANAREDWSVEKSSALLPDEVARAILDITEDDQSSGGSVYELHKSVGIRKVSFLAHPDGPQELEQATSQPDVERVCKILRSERGSS